MKRDFYGVWSALGTSMTLRHFPMLFVSHEGLSSVGQLSLCHLWVGLMLKLLWWFKLCPSALFNLIALFSSLTLLVALARLFVEVVPQFHHSHQLCVVKTWVVLMACIATLESKRNTPARGGALEACCNHDATLGWTPCLSSLTFATAPSSPTSYHEPSSRSKTRRSSRLWVALCHTMLCLLANRPCFGRAWSGFSTVHCRWQKLDLILFSRLNFDFSSWYLMFSAFQKLPTSMMTLSLMERLSLAQKTSLTVYRGTRTFWICCQRHWLEMYLWWCEPVQLLLN